MSNEIATRVFDDMLGPFDCTLDPNHRNGWLTPSFTLPVTRELSAQTIRMAEEYGYDSVDTIHVFDGRVDSADTVHVIDSGLTHEINKPGDREPLAIAVHIPWSSLDQGATASISGATREAREAADKSKVTGSGAARAVFVHVRWKFLAEDGEAANVIEPGRDGLYSIGGWEWCWHFASWWCVCGRGQHWHETDCLCGLPRDSQPSNPLDSVRWRLAAGLRRLAPEATSVLIDLHSGRPHVIAVFADDTEIDTGPFDTETLGAADAHLDGATDGVSADQLSTAPGWTWVPDETSAHLYQIALPPRP